MLVLLVAAFLDNVFLIDGGIEEFLIPSPTAFRLQGDVADAVLVAENILNLAVDLLYLA